MSNLEYLESVRDEDFKGIKDVEGRGVKALEIIAEELCKLHKYLITSRWCDIPKGKIVERRQNPND